MTADDFRRAALKLPGTAEGSHFGNPDFRTGGRIFATLSLQGEGYGVLLLTPDQQAGMVADAPDIFSPVPGGWGRSGSTRIQLSAANPDLLQDALRAAWQNRTAKNVVTKKRPRSK